jgi:hypothetical protein
MLEQSVTAHGGQHMCSRVQADDFCSSETRRSTLALPILQLLPDGQISFSCQDTPEKIFLFPIDPNHR